MDLKEETILILAALIIFGLFFLIKPTITGFIIYEPPVEGYIYDDSLINLSDNEIKLNQITEINEWTVEEEKTSYVTSAIRNDNDDTEKVQSLDEEISNVDKDKIFDVTFDHSLTNNDKIYMYLRGKTPESENSTDIYLCAASTACESPGHGLISYNGDEGWFSITITDLSSATTTFNIDPPIKVKFDYIYANYTETTEYNSTNTTYPSSASIETADIQPANLSRWNLFVKNDELNEQTINYQYSTDSRVSWNNVPADNNLSSVNSTKIKIKAILTSDGTATPIIYNMSLGYSVISETPACTEDWNCGNWSSCVNSTQNRTCVDLNDCGSEEEKPIEIQNCTEENQGNETNQTQQESPSESSSGSGGGGGRGSGGKTRFYRAEPAPAPETKEETPAPKPETKPAEIETEEESEIKKPLTGQVISFDKKLIKFSKDNLGFLSALFLVIIMYGIIRLERTKKERKKYKHQK